VIDVVAGAAHNCALLRNGVMKCWGDDSTKALGRANPQGNGCEGLADGNGVGPVLDLPVDNSVIKMAAGSHHTCALLADGALYCWGDERALGNNATPCQGSSATPRRVHQTDNEDHPISRFTDVATGDNLTCATGFIENGQGNDLDGRQLWCWGLNTNGQVGIGNDNNQAVFDYPMRIIGSGFGATSRLAAGSGQHACAGTSNHLWCWGAGTNAQLGSCAISPTDSPSRVMVSNTCDN
jgi:alpha-tubulin suppressor-like RCC1 family protein